LPRPARPYSIVTFITFRGATTTYRRLKEGYEAKSLETAVSMNLLEHPLLHGFEAPARRADIASEGVLLPQAPGVYAWCFAIRPAKADKEVMVVRIDHLGSTSEVGEDRHAPSPHMNHFPGDL
jgi:hypothetical protein